MSNGKFRVNFGNGQVSETFNIKKATQNEIEAAKARNEPYTGSYRIQFKENGEWFFCHRGTK